MTESKSRMTEIGKKKELFDYTTTMNDKASKQNAYYCHSVLH